MPPRINPDTYAGILHQVRSQLKDGGVEDWASSAEWLVTDALDSSRTDLFSRPDEPVGQEARQKLERWVRRRLDREPVQYIVGYVEFCGLRLHVDNRVLIPRPETELLVEHVVSASTDLSSVRILDIGTGSGCIAIALAKAIPSAEVVAVDVSGDALEVARMNAEAVGCEIEFVQSDILDATATLGPLFNIVVSNPPYIPLAEREGVMPEVADHEPSDALFVEGDPLKFYDAILSFCDRNLEPGGYVFFEVHAEFSKSVEMRMQRRHVFAVTGVEQDLAGLERIVWGRRLG